MAINDDVTAIEKAITQYAHINESVGYITAQIEETEKKATRASDKDDVEAYVASVDRLQGTRELWYHDRDKAEEKLRDAFEHYYS